MEDSIHETIQMNFFWQLRHEYLSMQIISTLQHIEYYLQICPLTNETSFYMMLRHIYEMINYYLEDAQIKSPRDVFRKEKLKKSFIVVSCLIYDILDRHKQLLRFYRQVFIGFLYSKIAMHLSKPVIVVNELEIS